MNRMCDACGTQPAATSYGGRRLCASCAQKRTAASALPFIGAALAAAGLIAGSALLAEKLQGEGRASPLDEIGKRLRGGTPTLDAYLARPDRAGPRRQARSGHRPRRRDRSHRLDPRAAQQEQSRVSSASPASARPRSSKGWRSESSAATRRRAARTNACSRSRSARSSRERSTAASSKAASSAFSTRSSAAHATSSSSSTSCTRSSAPAPPKARRSTSAR